MNSFTAIAILLSLAAIGMQVNSIREGLGVLDRRVIAAHQGCTP